MVDDKDKRTQPESDQGKETQESEAVLNVHNPFDANDKKEITEEDVKSMQDFKEAQTERD
jgi:hypothetical protein